MRAGHKLLLTALAALLLVLPAAPAGAATPREFFGVMLDGPGLDPGLDIAKETRLMASTGAGSVRVAFYWRQMQPEAGGPIDFAETDRVVAAAARAGLRVFPTVVRAPAWAAGGDDQEGAVPTDPKTYATFIGQVVRRYGRGGSFWASAGVPVRPAVSWQVWNEPDQGRYWQGDPWPRTYVKLLRAARPAIKAADPQAQVVMAGVTNKSWEDLQALYREGARKLFDAAAVHPFSRRPSNVLKIVRLCRSVMNRSGDARKPLVLSEISWSSGKGKSTFNYGWETSEDGQAQRIRQILPMLARERLRLRIQSVYWYTWLSPPEGDDESFSYAGLRRLKDGKPISKPALKAFKAAVKKLR
jgi:polysaccharide biosynthesis protein PslG